MKASAFTYARATSIANALDLLVLHGEKAKVLSGGQSLIPAMNLRLISPELIIDIGDIKELRGIAMQGETLVIGALTRHADLLKSSDIVKCAPLLAAAVAHVAHPAIRNRGTIGGSLAQADPASELPACMLALGATVVVRGLGGERRIAAEDFFTGIYETRLTPQDLLVAIEVPAARKGSAHFFQEFARRHGDYAIVGLSDRPRKARTGGSDRLEAQMLQRLRAADIPGVWKHKAPGFVQLAKCDALVCCCCRHDTSCLR